MNSISLIIVDDHEIVREGLRLTLQSEQEFEVVGEAASGKELMQLIKKLHPDVVLLDERMPDERGIEICQQLSKQNPEIKTIILTAYTEQEESIVQAMIAGAKGFLIKNVGITELKRAIRAVVRGETVLDSQVAYSIVNKLKQTPSSDLPAAALTKQQMTIANLVAQGLTNREIAEQLYLSENTIKFHIQNIMRKLEVHNRIALVAKLMQERRLQ